MPPLFLLDANACNARGLISELNELERLAIQGVIELLYTETTWDEAKYGSLTREGKVVDFFFVGLANEDNFGLQQPWRDAISKIVFPNGIRDERDSRDVEALVTTKIAGGIFVTNDGASNSQPGGILGHKAELSEIGIVVFSFSQALDCALKAAEYNRSN